MPVGFFDGVLVGGISDGVIVGLEVSEHVTLSLYRQSIDFSSNRVPSGHFMTDVGVPYTQ